MKFNRLKPGSASGGKTVEKGVLEEDKREIRGEPRHRSIIGRQITPGYLSNRLTGTGNTPSRCASQHQNHK
jgi:hypothetical protein